MLKIRLKRVGRRNDPSFRIVVAEATQGPKSNKFVEQLGSYNPKTKQRLIDSDRVKYWMGVGAQPSDTVFNMLIDEKVIDGKKRNTLPKKTPIIKEAQAAPEASETSPEKDTQDATEKTDGTISESLGEETSEVAASESPAEAPQSEK